MGHVMCKGEDNEAQDRIKSQSLLVTSNTTICPVQLPDVTVSERLNLTVITDRDEQTEKTENHQFQSF